MADIITTEVEAGVAIVTLNRPDARNALNTAMLRALPEAMASMESDDAVDVVVLTGADPAFCAGLDLKELGSSGDNLAGGGEGLAGRPWPSMTKPVIGAVNGPAVTGGLELALNCDFLVASERARFGDTHARVGVVPGWGLSVLLPQAIGVRRAKRLSLSAGFLDAAEALACGLVTEVVAHEHLLPSARALASEIVGNDRAAVRAILDEYKQTSAATVADAWEIEGRLFRQWRRRGFDPATVEARRLAILAKGRQATR